MSALDADEMMAQLLASEGFETIDEIAYVDLQELAYIEGLNEEIAEELQARAVEHLEKVALELDQKRRSLGVEDALVAASGLTLPMAIALGEAGIKGLEDLAGLTGDDLRGWYETRDGERVREPGILDAFQLSQDQADAIILQARIAAGWIDAPPEEALAESDGAGS
jgi:N utilization substance protein A